MRSSAVDRLRLKIGQMMMVGVSGAALTQEEQSIIQEYPFGGFILFSHNCCEPTQIVTLCRSLWKSREQIPPFIAIDQEGGRVHRLPQPFTHFPAAACLGSGQSAKRAYQMGYATARELTAVGINLNFAPVLDVHSNTENPIIGDRSLGSDPRQVASLGTALIRGLRRGGVTPCAKHFPGHGDTNKDSHLELPVVEKTTAELRGCEIIPFAYACRRNVESIMTAHVLYPALDARYPATLSYSIITGLLRQELGYEGVVFGDDMEMNAISVNYGFDKAALLGVHAGIDVLLFCHQLSLAIQCFEAFFKEAARSRALEKRIEESYARILKLKRRHAKAFTGVSEKQLRLRVGTSRHQQLALEINIAAAGNLTTENT